MLFRKRHDTNYRDLKEAPVPEGQHLLEVDDLPYARWRGQGRQRRLVYP